MKTAIAKMSSKGQIVIPKSYEKRSKCGGRVSDNQRSTSNCIKKNK